jgi:hypothetical protein
MNTPNSNDEGDTPPGNERSTKDGPFFWASIQALRAIREHFGTQASSAIAVYVALCSIASIKRKQTFECEIKQIAGHAGLRYRSCGEFIRELEAAKVISIRRNGGPKSRTAGAPSTYTLLTFRTWARNAYPPKQALPTGVGTGSVSKFADSIEENTNIIIGEANSLSPIKSVVEIQREKEGGPGRVGFALGAQPTPKGPPPIKNKDKQSTEDNQW